MGGSMWGLHKHHQQVPMAFPLLAILASYTRVLTATQAVDHKSHQL